MEYTTNASSQNADVAKLTLTNCEVSTRINALYKLPILLL